MLVLFHGLMISLHQAINSCFKACFHLRVIFYTWWMMIFMLHGQDVACPCLLTHCASLHVVMPNICCILRHSCPHNMILHDTFCVCMDCLECWVHMSCWKWLQLLALQDPLLCVVKEFIRNAVFLYIKKTTLYCLSSYCFY